MDCNAARIGTNSAASIGVTLPGSVGMPLRVVRDLEAELPAHARRQHRETVEQAFIPVDLCSPARERFQIERIDVFRPDPEQRLSRHFERRPHSRQQRARPTANGHDEARGVVGTGAGDDVYARRRLAPFEHRLRGLHARAVSQRRFAVQPDRLAGEHEAAVRLVQRVVAVRYLQRPPAPRHRLAGQFVARKLIAPRRLARTRYQLGIGATDVHRAGTKQHAFAAARLEVVPVRIRPLQQRHVVRVLEIRFADQTRVAAARSLVVRDAIAFQAEHRGTASRELIERGRSHRAESDDDHVVVARLRHRCGPACQLQPRIRTRALNWVNGVEPSGV